MENDPEGELTSAAPKLASHVRATVRRALLCWFAVAFWRLPYRTMIAAHRRRLKVVLLGGYACGVVVGVLGGELVLAVACTIFLGATHGALRLIDQELADTSDSRPEPAR